MPLTGVEKIIWRVRDLVFAPPVRGRLVEGPVVVAGLFRAASGIGRAARGCAEALEKAGGNITRVDLSGVFGQEDLPADPRLTTMPTKETGTLILHCNAPEADRALLALRHFHGKRWRIVGCWVWETSVAPESWRRASRRLSEIWTPSRFAADAIAAVSAVPVRAVPHFVAAPDGLAADRKRFNLEDEQFVCLAMADGRSSFFRKNPIGAIRAFRRGLGERPEARLVVKARNLGEQPAFKELLSDAAEGDRRIIILEEDFTEDDQWRLLACADVFISLHRSEGFGLPVAEAMALGKAVIATGWSGTAEFLDPDAAIAAPWKLEPVDDPSLRYKPADGAVWAEPDEDAAARALHRLAGDPALRRTLGETARAAIARHCGAGAYADALQTLPGANA